MPAWRRYSPVSAANACVGNLRIVSYRRSDAGGPRELSGVRPQPQTALTRPIEQPTSWKIVLPY
jgi:hypothetical protein